MAWKDFVALNEAGFKEAFNLKPLAPVGSSLADNIAHILNRLADYPAAVRHVALVFSRKEHRLPRGVAPCAVSFRLVTFTFTSINRGGLFLL